LAKKKVERGQMRGKRIGEGAEEEKKKMRKNGAGDHTFSRERGKRGQKKGGRPEDWVEERGKMYLGGESKPVEKGEGARVKPPV